VTTWLGLTAMRQEAEVRRFSDYLVRFDRHEAGSRGEEVTGVDHRAGTKQLSPGHQARLPDVK
jgi:hypothetical protein